jgi:hypothetical protein
LPVTTIGRSISTGSSSIFLSSASALTFDTLPSAS